MHTCTCSEFCTLNAHTNSHTLTCILVRHRYTATVLNMTSQRWLTREVCLLHSPCCAVGVGLLLQYALTHSLTHSNYSSHICVSHSIVHTWPHHARHNQITSRHDTSHHITSHHITSHHITSHHITSRHITSHHITSHHITSHHITSPQYAGLCIGRRPFHLVALHRCHHPQHCGRGRSRNDVCCSLRTSAHASNLLRKTNDIHGHL
jgi:hypothetical protein